MLTRPFFQTEASFHDSPMHTTTTTGADHDSHKQVTNLICINLRRIFDHDSLQSVMARIMVRVAFTTLLFSLFFLPLSAQLLHPTDMLALRALKASLHDLPGGTFFTTWQFALRINPCMSFAGLQCTQIGTFNRVISLSLGPPSAGPPGLGGTLPSALGDLTYLQSLTISPGEIQGTIPDSIANLQSLKTFSLSANAVSGRIPSAFGSLKSLETLQIRKNHIEGQVPAGIGGLRALRVLVLAENRLWGSVPTLRDTALLHLDLRGNDLSGELPELPTSVVYLAVTKNRFSGVVSGLEGMNGLVYLDLSFNGFSGGVPSFLFEYPLAFLLLNHNQFRGAVSVPAYVSIPVVDLSHNHLQGIISPYLAGAQSLFLNNNLFVGTVPQDFASKLQESSLQSLFLQHNYLTDAGALGVASLPPTVSVCLQYNCMIPPRQFLCPPNVDMPASRPEYQCQKASNGSPED